MNRRCCVIVGVMIAVLCVAPVRSAIGQVADYGDAPDGINACQIGFSCVAPPSNYPTLNPSANAAAGRTGPFHISTAPAGGDYFLGPNFVLPLVNTLTIEAAAHQPCCDWITPPSVVCDEDDIFAVLCLNPACTSGVVVAGPVGTCGLGFLTGAFGPVPPGAPGTVLGFWIFGVGMGAAEAPAGLARFANVVVDFDMSGVFGDLGGEWVLQDAPIAFLPGAVQFFGTPGFPVVVTVNAGPPLTWGVDGFWTRFMVGPEAVTASFGGAGQPALWDGSGVPAGYTRGETEDWYTVGDPAEPFEPGSEPFDSIDCNNNGIPDAADIWFGDSPDSDGNGRPDECSPTVPTVSEWGVVVMLLVVLAAGTITIRMRRTRRTA